MSIFTNPSSGSAEHARAYIAGILETLGDKDPVTVLEETPRAFRRTTEGLSPKQLCAPEAAGKWSIAQTLRHMADSEIVWSWRLRMVLAHDRPPLTGYDQDLWAERLGYTDADAAESLEEFAILRRGNLRLLRHASPADLKRVGMHEERGEESAEHMIKLYAGHDLVHRRQLQRIRQAVPRS